MYVQLQEMYVLTWHAAISIQVTSEVRIVTRTEADLLASVAERFRPAASPLSCCVPVSPQQDERGAVGDERDAEGDEQEQDEEEWFRSHMLECVEMERRHRLEREAEERRLCQERDDRKRRPRVQRLASYMRQVLLLTERCSEGRTRMRRRHEQERDELLRLQEERGKLERYLQRWAEHERQPGQQRHDQRQTQGR